VKSRRDYKQEARREPFTLELDTPVEGGPTFVTFLDPSKVATEDAFALGRSPDAETTLRSLLSDEDYEAWFREWRQAPADETNALLEDIQRHYGADPGKLPR
jgi:hypothetical protein